MTALFKQEAHKLADNLPNTASWCDSAEQIETTIDIDVGLADSLAGRITDNARVRREFGLT